MKMVTKLMFLAILLSCALKASCQDANKQNSTPVPQYKATTLTSTADAGSTGIAVSGDYPPAAINSVMPQSPADDKSKQKSNTPAKLVPAAINASGTDNSAGKDQNKEKTER